MKRILFFFIGVIVLALAALTVVIVSANIVMFFTKDPVDIFGFTLLLSILISIPLAPLYLIGGRSILNKLRGEDFI